MGVEYRHFLVARRRAFAPNAAQLATLVEALRAERWVLTPKHPAFKELLRLEGPAPARLTTGGYVARPADLAPGPPRRAMAVEPVPLPVTPAWVATLRDGRASDPLRDELAFTFPVGGDGPSLDELGVRYPFTLGSGEPGYYALVIHVARDFVHHSSDQIDEVDTACVCGENLGYDTDDRALRLAIDCEFRIRRVCPHCKRPFDPQTRVAAHRDAGARTALPGLEGGGVYRFALVVDCGKAWPRTPDPPALAPALRELVGSTLGEPLVDFGEFY